MSAHSRLPPSYIDVNDRCVTPFDRDRERIGIAFEVPAGSVLRVAVTREHALELARLLLAYCSPAGSQSPESELSPREPRSVPSPGANV